MKYGKQQAIPGEKFEKPGDLEKSFKIRRLLAALGDLTGLYSGKVF